MGNFFSIIVLVFLAVFGFPVAQAHAAEFRVAAENGVFGVGEEFMVTLRVDTQGELINAFEGKVVFPEDLLALKEVRERNSIVNLWIEDPPVFSGLTPGGYAGEGVLFSLVFEIKAAGQGRVAVEEARALLNDGAGTPAELEISDFAFGVSHQTPVRQARIENGEDTEPPESFEIRVVQSPDIFAGKPFLVFATQDKDSGISHYEVSFMRNGEQTGWQRAKNPLLLESFEKTEKVWVKAVDRAGNERVEFLSLKEELPFWQFLLYGNIAIVGVIGVGLVFWLWRRNQKKAI